MSMHWSMAQIYVDPRCLHFNRIELSRRSCAFGLRKTCLTHSQLSNHDRMMPENIDKKTVALDCKYFHSYEHKHSFVHSFHKNGP